MKDMFSSLRLQGRSYSSAPLFDLHHLMTVTFGFSFLRRPGWQQSEQESDIPSSWQDLRRPRKMVL